LLPSRSARALEVGCAEGAFTRLLAGQVDHLTAVDISATAIARARARCSDLDNVEFATYDVFAPDAEPVGEGKFDLIVASEVLYYAPDLESLRLALRRLVSALAPDGALVVVHANLVVDEPSQPGFDWNLAAGSAGIHAELEKLGNVALSEQRHARYFTAERWERAGGHSRLFRRRPKSEVLDGIPEPPPRALRTFLPDGGNVDDTDSDASTGLLPVLMYHRIAPETPAAGARWAITPEGFEEQLAWLREQNFESTSVEEWALACANDRDLPGRRVLITFDDGLQDFADHALPLLVKYGYKADMHIVSGRVGQTNDWEMAGFPRYRLMDWDTLADLPRHTVTLGSHTVNHRSFAVLDPVEAMQELIRSRVTLEDRLGRAINRIAFPYGSFDHSTLLQAAAAGYDYAYTTNDWLAGRDRNPLRIPRLDVWGGLGINQFATLVTTGIQEAGVAGA
jgi:peptidoglycan/xylan/chitin deacetylase (PgdA/CDA1 family)